MKIKNRLLALLLLFLLAFSMCACSTNDAKDKTKAESDKDSKKDKKKEKDKDKDKNKDKDKDKDKEEPDDVVEPDDEPIIPSVDATLDYEDISISFYDEAIYEWQFAYYNFLQEKAKECGFTGHDDYFGGDDDIYEYSLYDINQDGIPELFVEYGNCEANYRTEIYSYDPDDYDMFMIEDELWTGHSSLATYPDGDGFVVDWGHMGSTYVEVAMMDDDYNITYEEIFSEIIDGSSADYTPIDEIVLGSEYIDQYCFCLGLPLLTYVSDVYTSSGVEDSSMIALFNQVITDDIPFLQVNGYHFYSEPTELTTWSAFCEEGGADNFSESKVNYTIDVDMNDDGQLERLVFFDNDTTAILSYQEEMIYAYVISYLSGQDVVAVDDGKIFIENTFEEGYYQLIFDKNECYLMNQLEWVD